MHKNLPPIPSRLSKSRRPMKDPIMWTHAFFLVNILLYLTSAYASIGVLFALNTIASFMYHRTAETSKWWAKADKVLTHGTLAFILAYVFICCTAVQIALLLVWLVGSIIVWDEGRRSYTVMHSLWHFLVFGGNVIAWSYLPPICLV